MKTTYRQILEQHGPDRLLQALAAYHGVDFHDLANAIHVLALENDLARRNGGPDAGEEPENGRIHPDDIKTIAVFVDGRLAATFTEPLSLLTAVYQLNQSDHRKIKKVIEGAAP